MAVPKNAQTRLVGTTYHIHYTSLRLLFSIILSRTSDSVCKIFDIDPWAYISYIILIFHSCMCPIYRIAGNFRGRKLSRISRFFSHPRKFSPRNSRHATPIMRPVLTFRESILCEMLLSYRSAKVFRYTVLASCPGPCSGHEATHIIYNIL